MPLRMKYLFTSAVITTVVITVIVLAFHFFTGGTSLYEAGKFLLLAGIGLTVIVIPLFYRSHHRARLHIHLHAPVDERNRLISDPYYDHFAGVALGVVLTVALSFGIMAIASNLEGRRSLSTNVPAVGSVKAELPNLYKRAKMWQSDAYLVELRYNFGGQSIYPTYDNDYILSADFRSFSEANTSLVIEVSWTGKYLMDYDFPLQPSENWQSPISDQNWTIDSQEAISVFAKDRAMRACLNLDHPKKLTLTQAPSLGKGQVVWCLRMDECYEIDGSICIDAVTGDPVSPDQ